MLKNENPETPFFFFFFLVIPTEIKPKKKTPFKRYKLPFAIKIFKVAWKETPASVQDLDLT